MFDQSDIRGSLSRSLGRSLGGISVLGGHLASGRMD